MSAYLKPHEVAAHYQVSMDTVYRWIKEGRLQAENIGSGNRPTWRIPADQLRVRQAPVIDMSKVKKFLRT